MTDIYIYAIAALLPLAAWMTIFQVNPYHALVIRGILGAVAAMLYAILGAADVALTEALVGTMLAITLYAVAVRSSLVMRLGVLKDELNEAESDRHFEQLMDNFRRIFAQHHMQIELIPYTDPESLQQALIDKQVHTTCIRKQRSPQDEEKLPYHTVTRVQRLYDIMQTELSSPATILTYVNTLDSGEKH